MPEAKKPTKKPATKSASAKGATNIKVQNAKSGNKNQKNTTTKKSVPKNTDGVKKLNTKKNTSAKKPTHKTSKQVIDSFTVPTDRKKTVAGETNLELTDLEARVENFESQKLIDEQPQKSDKRIKTPSKTAKKEHKGLRIFSSVLGIVMGVSFIALCTMLAVLNILPTQYIVPSFTVLGVLAIVIVALLVRKKTKIGVRIPLCVVAMLCSIVNIFGIVYLNKTFNFFDSLKGQEYLTEKYYVIVKKDSSYQDIKDLKGKTIGTFDEGIEIYEEALKKLEEKVDANIEKVDAINGLPTNLDDGTVDAILLSAVHQAMFEEEDTTSKIMQDTRTIYTIEIKVKAETETEHPAIDVTSEPFTVYISGSDAYGTISDRSRSDVNMLAVVNPTTHEILLVSIPRDYYVQLHGTTGARDKLTHAGIYGVQMSANTISDLLGVKIDYYIKANFSTVESLVDTIGGIDVYSDQQFKPLHGNSIVQKGNNHFDGAMALAFARERYAYATGDRHRVQNQQDVLKAIIKKVTSSTVILTKYSEILNDIANCLETNVGKDEITNLVKLQLQDMPSWQIGEYSLNGSDSRNITYSMGQQLLYVMEPDTATVETAHNYITGVLEGKSLQELGLTGK